MEFSNLEDKLIQVFKRVFGREFVDNNINVNKVEEWDSLSHIKLIIELESEFKITIEPDSIPLLYSDFSTILNFLKKTTL